MAPSLDLLALALERVFEQFVVDIGFAKSATLEPDRVRTSDFLSFADIEPLELPAIPLAQHLAEKVHAYTRSYGAAGRPSTRPEDLIDILLIADSQTLEAAAVREALEHAFETRARQTLPESLPAPPPEWAPDYARLAEEVGLEPDLTAAFGRAAAFLDPVLSGEARGSWVQQPAHGPRRTTRGSCRDAAGPPHGDHGRIVLRRESALAFRRGERLRAALDL